MIRLAPGRPLAWIIAAVAVAMALGLLTAGWSRLWSALPWSAERRAERAEVRIDRLKDDAALKDRLFEAERAAVPVVVAARTLTIEAQTLARSAPDAETPLAADRAERLRHADRRLCDATGLDCRPLD